MSTEKTTKPEVHRSIVRPQSEPQLTSNRTERVRIDRDRVLRQENKQRARNDRGEEGRRHADTTNHHVPLERRLSSYERQSHSPNDLPPPSPPSQTSNRGDYDTRSSGRVRAQSPSRNHSLSQQFRGPRAHDEGIDGRRLPPRPRSPNSDVGERGYGKSEVRSAMSSRGGSLLDRLSGNNRTGERDVEDRSDDRVTSEVVNMASNGQEPAGDRRDNSRRRRRPKVIRR